MMNIQDYWLQNQMAKQGGVPMPSNNPAVLAAMQPAQVPQNNGNPIREGAHEAIQSVRQSIGMRPPREGIFGNILDSVGKSISNLGIARMRGSYDPVKKQLGNMMQSIDERELLQQKQNMDALQFLAKQQQYNDLMEHRRQQLEEQRRYHNLRIGAAKASGRGRRKGEEEGAADIAQYVDLSKYPKMKNAGERNKIAERLDASNHARELLLKIRENLNKLKDMGGKVDPIFSRAKGYNELADYFGSITGSERFELRNALNSDFSSLELLLDRSLKGGVPDAQMIKRLHAEKVYPSMGLPLQANKKKVDEYLKRVDKKAKLLELSLMGGRHIKDMDPAKLNKIYKLIKGDEYVEDELITGLPGESNTGAAAAPNATAKAPAKESATNYMKNLQGLSDEELAAMESELEAQGAK